MSEELIEPWIQDMAERISGLVREGEQTQKGEISMTAEARLDAISELWDELDITQLLEEHIPLHRRFLVDRLLGYLNDTADVESD
jgi:hypothetical protein